MNIKKFYEEKLHETREQFAQRIGVEPAVVEEWEHAPAKMAMIDIQKVVEATGATFDEVLNYQRPMVTPIHADREWDIPKESRRVLDSYVEENMRSLKLTAEQVSSYVDPLAHGIGQKLQKPKVKVIGHSDSGKSTLINSMLGMEILPTAWTPTTSIAIYLKHISDKPEHLKEPVWIFKGQMGENIWDESRINDADYCAATKIQSGGNDLLRIFGTWQGENFSVSADTAVVFLDAPILKSCDVIDLPGYGTGNEMDDSRNYAFYQKGDVLIYLSQANSFLHDDDFDQLKANLKTLPVWEWEDSKVLTPLSNLFVVATQAHIINNGNTADINTILDNGCKRLLLSLPDSFWDIRKEQSFSLYEKKGAKELRPRFFAYTTDIPSICEPFNKALEAVLNALPEVIDRQAREYVKEYVDSRTAAVTSEIESYESVIGKREKWAAALARIDSGKEEREKQRMERRKKVMARISELRESSSEEFQEKLDERLNVDAIQRELKNSGLKNRKEDIEIFVSRFQSSLQDDLEGILQDHVLELSDVTDSYLDTFGAELFDEEGLEVSFDSGWQFANALSGIGKVGMLGGFGLWVGSTISGALLFTGLGYSLGSALYFGATTASLFGPVGLAIGFALAAVVKLVHHFSGGWERNVAKQIVGSCEKHNLNGKFRKAIDEFWLQTETEFDRASEQVERDWKQRVQKLRDLVDSHRVQDLHEAVDELGKLKTAMDGILTV